MTRRGEIVSEIKAAKVLSKVLDDCYGTTSPVSHTSEIRAAKALSRILTDYYGSTSVPDIWQLYHAYIKAEWRLTNGQAVVALEALKGKSNREIAERLGISKETVNKHLDQVLTKSGCHTRGQLAATLLESANLILDASS